MMINYLLQHYKLLLLFMCLCIQPGLIWAEPIVISGSCKQFNEAITKGDESSAREAFTYGLYRSVMNGQVTAYNHALLMAGYDKLLIPKEFQKKEVFFLDKVIIRCKQVKPESYQFSVLVAQSIFSAIKENYKDQKISLNFKAMLANSEIPPMLFSKQASIDFGSSSCGDFSKITTEKKYFNHVYKYWIIGYFVPFAMIENLEPEHAWLITDELYKKASTYCEEKPERVFAAAVFEVLSEHFNQ